MRKKENILKRYRGHGKGKVVIAWLMALCIAAYMPEGFVHAGTIQAEQNAGNNTQEQVKQDTAQQTAQNGITEEEEAFEIYRTTDGAASTNCSQNSYLYGRYAHSVSSYLSRKKDGNYIRLEYISATYAESPISEICVEEYSSDFQLLSSKTIAMELPIFGGYFEGEQYNYLVFGQENMEESKQVEELRVVKYDKNWKRVAATSMYEKNTVIPFDAGSLRMTETEDMLYIHTCHEMYQSSDGRNHQANMTFVINQETMEIAQEQYNIANYRVGYISHSFNQFIETDGEYVYRLDQGDAYPRAVLITKCKKEDIYSCSYKSILSIAGEIGDNRTGVTLGGFELIGNQLVTAGTSIDQENFTSSSTKNVFVKFTDKDLKETKTVWLTNYEEDSSVDVLIPQVVEGEDDTFYVMWEEQENVEEEGCKYVTKSVKIVKMKADGTTVEGPVSVCESLSDCKPLYTNEGKIVWYVTRNDAPTFCVLDTKKMANVRNTSLKECTVFIEDCPYSNYLSKPEVKVTYKGKELSKGKDYKIAKYSTNGEAGNGTVVLTGGIEKYTGAISCTYEILPETICITGTERKDGKWQIVWGRGNYATGYEIYEKQKEEWTKIGTTEELSYLFADGEPGKEYVVKVRAYKEKDGRILYGEYSKEYSFKYTCDLQFCDITLGQEQHEYRVGDEMPKPDVLVKWKGKELLEGTDYKLSYTYKKESSEIIVVEMTIAGIGNYCGTAVLTCKIVAQKATLKPTKSATPKPQATVSVKATKKPTEKPKTTVYPKATISPTLPTKNTVLTDNINNCKVKVISSSTENPTVAYVKNNNINIVNVSVPSTVTIDNVTFKVTEIGAGAFSGNQKLTKVTLGKNVTIIRKNAFKNCSRLKKIIIKSSSLKTVGANAIKGTNKSLVVKAPSNKVSAYKKLFKRKGNAKVVVKK